MTSPLRALLARPKDHLPALDALRVLAVLLIFLGHLRSSFLDHGGQDNLFLKLPVVKLGWLGADLFFVVSGYLIGKHLFSGSASAGRFLLRRALRVWPLYFASFLFSAFVLGALRDPATRWWSDAVFLGNYLDHGVVRGAWLICSNEQFALIAALVISLTAASARGSRVPLVILFLLLPVVRAVTWQRLTGGLFRHDAEAFVGLIDPLHLHADGLVAGLTIASVDTPSREALAKSPWSSGWAVLAGLLAFGGLMVVQREIFTFTGAALLFGAATAWLTARVRPTLLDARPIHILARLSFGMYLNHRYLLEGLMDAFRARVPTGNATVQAGLAFLVFTLLSALTALLTWCLIEHPFLELRCRWLDARSPS